MQAWRITKNQYALDRDGTGAKQYGGRWNSAGVAVIYAAITAELAAMEKLVHTSNFLPTDLVLVDITMPEDKNLYVNYGFSQKELQGMSIGKLPKGWDTLPSSQTAAILGDQFISEGKYLGMIVPSVIIPESSNIILNPAHPAMSQVTMNILRPFLFDARLKS